ncbi:MAG: hypothetical protein ACT4TC_07250 [Myxococcaceae bacterium]
MADSLVSQPQRQGIESSGPGRLLVVQPNGKRLRELLQVLRSVAGHVEGREGLGDLESSSQYDLLLVDYDRLNAEDRARLVKAYLRPDRPTRLLVLSGGECRRDFVHLFGSRTLTNLLGKEDILSPEDIIVTVQKLLRGDIFGIEKYFTWGVEPVRMVLRRATEKERVISVMQDYANSLGVHPRLVNLYCVVADELLTNAVYNAPVDANGVPRYAELSRDVEVVLKPEEYVEVVLCSDGHRLGIATIDPFGSLRRERLLTYLSKCFQKGPDQVDQKKGGAGLGFYSVFESLSHFVVNIQPGTRTEMIGLIDVRGTYRDFANRNKSFNVFISE